MDGFPVIVMLCLVGVSKNTVCPLKKCTNDAPSAIFLYQKTMIQSLDDPKTLEFHHVFLVKKSLEDFSRCSQLHGYVV